MPVSDNSTPRESVRVRVMVRTPSRGGGRGLPPGVFLVGCIVSGELSPGGYLPESKFV